MSHLWPVDWYDLADGADALQNIAAVWRKKGYGALTSNDYARMEPFLEPFDGLYTDQEIAILSRIGNNGVQKEFCSMFLQAPSAPIGADSGAGPEAEVWVLEWYLDKDDIRRLYLRKISKILYGAEYGNDETQCMIMLTHALSNLRRLRITIQGDRIIGEPEDGDEGPAAGDAAVTANSLEEPRLSASGYISVSGSVSVDGASLEESR